MFDDNVTIDEMKTWNKRYKLDNEDICHVIDVVEEKEYWTVHPNEAYILCLDLNRLYEENSRLEYDNHKLGDALENLKKEHNLLHDECVELECKIKELKEELFKVGSDYHIMMMMLKIYEKKYMNRGI